jgi:hypothetical protein
MPKYMMAWSYRKNARHHNPKKDVRKAVCNKIIKMADFREQRTCIKFCFKLQKTATECYEMLKTAFGKKLWVVPKHFSGFPGLRQAELRLMMTRAVNYMHLHIFSC